MPCRGALATGRRAAPGLARVPACRAARALAAWGWSSPAGAWPTRSGSPAPGGAGRAGAARAWSPAPAGPIDQLWRPDMARGDRLRAHADRRHRVRGADQDGRFYGYRPDHNEWSASVVKAMLLVTYLDEPSVRGRALTARDEVSARTDDHGPRQRRCPDRVRHGRPGGAERPGAAGGHDPLRHQSPVWGETRSRPRDQTRFFLHIDGYVVARHRALCDVAAAQAISPADRWGIGELAPSGWKLYFKGGWGYGTGLLDHQVALLVRGCARVSIAVLTMYDGSHPYGKETLKGIFERLLRGFRRGSGRPTRASVAAARRRRRRRRRAARRSSATRCAGGRSPRRCSGPDDARRKILLVGCIHGNECAGRGIPSAVARLGRPARGAAVAGAGGGIRTGRRRTPGRTRTAST